MQKTTERTVEQVFEMFLEKPYHSREVKEELGLSNPRWMFIKREVAKRAAENGMVFGYHPQLGKHRLVNVEHEISLEIIAYSFKLQKNGAQTLQYQIAGAKKAGALKAHTATKLRRLAKNAETDSANGQETIKRLQARVVRDAQGRFARV